MSADNSRLPVSGVYLMVAAIAALLSSCSSGFPLQHEGEKSKGDAPAATYSIVFVIHGDGDYLYHDTHGNAYTADEEALAGAMKVAEQNPHAEAFIFHQKPRRHFLFVFPLRDGEFYYYRNGHLVADESYWRDQDSSRLQAEAELYRRFRSAPHGDAMNLFLYYGHEIPEFGGAGYDASYPDRPFTVHELAQGLQGLKPDSARFDLLILSTCFGGTPYTINTVGQFARYIIASPDNLHLSYFDLQPLERLDASLPEQRKDVHPLARRFAQQAFARLTNDVQTAVSVAVYDVERVQQYLHAVQSVYGKVLTIANQKKGSSSAEFDHCDCTDISSYALPSMKEGVEIFYRPAAFGRSARRQYHSGWECWQEKQPLPASSQADRAVAE